MADNNDVRWLQRYDSFRKALDRLESVTLSGRHPSDLSELEKSGLVQWFEFTYELAWKVMQDYTPVLHKLSETLASQRQLTGV
ncbi:MAG: nucleotidyltransferase substrate binding protein [Prevotella sp.]|nr:nucleotidyltransferase substrate binding protein [Prevotella sp.]